MSKTILVITNNDKVILFPSIDVFRDGHFTGTSRAFTRDGYNSHEYILETARDMATEYSDPVILDKWDKPVKFSELMKELKELSPMPVMYPCYK